MLRFHFQWGENEIKMARDMQETFRAIIEAVGGTYLDGNRNRRGIFPTAFHRAARLSTKPEPCAWGTIPRLRPSTPFCQAHEVKNLFVTDGACFVTNPDKNPTLSILALSWRASEYLLDEAKKGNI